MGQESYNLAQGNCFYSLHFTIKTQKANNFIKQVCDLPFVFFSDPELTPILGGTLVAACYGCEQNRDVVQQELSTEMLLALLRSCRQGLPCARPPSLILDAPLLSDHTTHVNQIALDQQKRVDGRAGFSSGVKGTRSKIQHSGKLRTGDDLAFKQNQPSLRNLSSTFMLHSKLPSLLLDKTEEFFLAGIPIDLA